MRLFALTALTMVAFAANSLLNRQGLLAGGLSADGFAAIRLLAGALTLATLVLLRRGGLRITALKPRRTLVGAISLLIYLFGFSFAYQLLDAGLGALLLFGAVQVTMFGAALLAKEPMPGQRIIGAGIALMGLLWLLWPSGGTETSLPHALLMLAAGVGWGIYSLNGRHAADPLQETALNFVLAAPVGLVILMMLTQLGQGAGLATALAVLSGAVTSGLGYALWYQVLPGLGASRAAVAQLTVPPLAILAGVGLLGEVLTLELLLATVLVLGGVLLSLRAR